MERERVINLDDFLKWACLKENSLIIEIVNEEEEPPTTTKDISEYSKQQLKEAYEDADARCKSLRKYMSTQNYKTLIYNYALHIAIVNSTFDFEIDNNNIFDKPEPAEALQKLYVKYSIASATTGIITSSSSGGSSASQQIPNSLAQGDLETSDLLKTAYGKTALYFLEQLNGIII